MNIDEVKIYVLVFFIYAFAGWVMETTSISIRNKKFVNRGFLIGPVCPIYGYGVVLVSLLLQKYQNDIIVTFFMSIIICGFLEYFTSYFMEIIFKARWWDYSQRKFNINGRVCLNTIIPFGLLGMFIMDISNPFLIEKIEALPELFLNILFWLLLIIYLIDNIVSTNIISYVGKTTKEFGKELDNTEEITKMVKEALIDKSKLYSRLLNAYPKIQAIKVKLKEKQNEFKKQVEEQKEELKESVKKQKSEIKTKMKITLENQKKCNKRKGKNKNDEN